MGTIPMIECDTCGYAVFIDESDPEEVEDWGEKSAECVNCGTKYRDLLRNSDGTWTDKDGRRLKAA